MLNCRVVVVGDGPAELVVACSAHEAGVERMLVPERDKEPGDILNQYIHSDFGLHYFEEGLTGPEYAGHLIQRVSELGVEILLDTMVLSVEEDHTVRAVNCRDGPLEIQAGTVVLAMGCQGRTRGAITIPGNHPARIFTAGTAQRYIGTGGWMVGRRVAILGSEDVGLIMTRRMTLEGANVLTCVELMSYFNGLNRNIVQYLKDYGIPLYLSHTIMDIVGRERVEQVIVSKVGADHEPIPGTEIAFGCNTVLLGIGLIPENELTRAAGIPIDSRTSGTVVFKSMETAAPGIFSCGNVVHVRDLVDFVAVESQRTGVTAARYATAGQSSPTLFYLRVQNGASATYTMPQKIRPAHVERGVDLFFRIDNVYRNRRICATSSEEELCSLFKERMAPDGVEHIVLPGRLLERAGDGELTVSLTTEKETKE